MAIEHNTATENNLVIKIDILLSKLNRELTADDIKGGWTPKKCDSAITLLKELKSGIKLGETIANLSIPRGLDYWGIFGGPLLEEIAMLSNDYNQWALTHLNSPSK